MRRSSFAVRANQYTGTALEVFTTKMFDASGLIYTLWKQYHFSIIIGFTVYIAVVRLLRYRRMRKIEGPFTHGKRELSSMTTKEAHAIIVQLQEFEFPYAFGKARKIALLKVRQWNCGKFKQHYGIQVSSNLALGWRYPDHVQALRSYRPKQQA